MDTQTATLAAFICLPSATKLDSQEGSLVDEAAMDNISSTATNLSEKLSERLPSYMVPSIYVPVRFVPMTATGKTHRRQLRDFGASLSRPELEKMRGIGAESQQQPQTNAEYRLAFIWASLLNIPVDSISRHSSFFNLGGDSIAAMKLVAEARTFGMQFTVAEIFNRCSIAALCDGKTEASRKNSTSARSDPKPFQLVDIATRANVLTLAMSHQAELTADKISDILPATDFQAQFIRHGLEHPLSAFNYLLLDVGTKLDRDQLRDSCQSLVDKFPVLRTVFVNLHGRCWQLVLYQCRLNFSEATAENDLKSACHEICLHDSEGGLSPAQLPTAFTLVQSQHQGRRLIIRLSHAQYDGFSIPILLGALSSFCCDRQVELSPDYSSFVAHQTSHREKSAIYWKRLLQSSRPTQILPRLSDGIEQETLPFRVQAEASIPMPALDEHVYKASLIGFAWAVMLSVLTEQDDVVFGHLLAARDVAISRIEGIAGPCATVIPIRVEGLTTLFCSQIMRTIHEQQLSLGQTGTMMGCDDIIDSCAHWPEGAKVDSVVQHQNVAEHPEVELGGVSTRLAWHDNFGRIPPVLTIMSYCDENRFRIQILASSREVSFGKAQSLVNCLGQIIGATSSNLEQRVPARLYKELRSSLLS